jgi:hypothetical protein
MFLKKGLFIVAGLTLAFANYAYAGSNAAAVLSMDYVGSGAAAAGNGTDDKVVTGVVAGTGTQFKVEIFAAGLTAGLTGAEARFKIDKSLIKVVNPTGGVTAPSTFPLILPNTDTTATVGAFAAGLPPAGLLMTVTFETVADVTGKEFAIDVYFVQVAASPTDFDNLVGAKVSFNAVPKVILDKSIVTIPRGGQATATVTASGFPAGATITFSKTQTGSATVTGATNSSGDYVLTASGSGSAVVTVTATDGTTTTAGVVVRFDEQVPVELAAFGGELVENQVVLNWTTASQTNNAGFRVLRSTDQENFEVVSEVIGGAGTTDALMNYSFNDGSLPASEQVFYVLEQIDLDGTIHRSNPIEVILGARFVLPTEFASAVFPNPFNPSTTISYDLPAEAQVSIVIYDAIGQEVRQLVNKSHAAGRYSVQWDAKNQIGRSVGSGVYIAKVKAGTFSSTQKMLLLK